MPIEIALMVEGQNGLTWPRWQAIAALAEQVGCAGLYRSDHFTNANPPDVESLELWTSLTWLASHTRRLEFGPLVSPVSFRHPALTARMAAAVDDLSGGRLQLGLGAGWQEREHTLFGFDLLEVGERFARFEEGLQVIGQLLRSDEPSSFDGTYYQLRDATLLPRPARRGGPPIVIGGNGARRSLPLAARYADEWNAVFVPVERFVELSRHLDSLLDAAHRPREAVRRTLMAGVRFARTADGLESSLDGESREALHARGVLIGHAGDPGGFRAQIDALDRAGVQRVMLQWLDLDDLDGLEAMARIAVG